jgi:hypothetical protein
MSAYQADPNNNKKQTPKGRPASAISKATTPPSKVIQDRPNYIMVNVEGSYTFCYESTASLGGGHGDLTTYISGSKIDDGAGPIRLDINPIAWEQADGSPVVGNITFIYTGDLG